MTATQGAYDGVSHTGGTRLDDAYQVVAVPEKNGVGSASFTIPYGGTFTSAWGRRDICIAVEPDVGSPADIFNGIVTQIIETQEGPEDDAARVYQVSVSGPADILKSALIYPPRGVGKKPNSPQRIFNYSMIDLDDSAWTATLRYARTVIDPWNLGYYQATGWPDPISEFTGPRAVDGNGSMPLGSWFERKHITLGANKILVIMAVADDSIDLYLDEVLMLKGVEDPGENLEETMVRYVRADAGAHVFAWETRNYFRNSGNVGNPSSSAVSIYQFDTFDQDLDTSTFLWHTGLMPGGGGPPVADGALCLDFPSTRPGLTPGQLIIKLITECQTRLTALGITWDFSATLDSKGAAWALPPAEFLRGIGDSVYSILEMLTVAYVDWAFVPGTKRLQMVNKGTMGSATSMAIQDADGDSVNPNIRNLTYTVDF